MRLLISMLCLLVLPLHAQSLITEKLEYYGCNIYYLKGNASNLTFYRCDSTDASAISFNYALWAECSYACCGLSSENFPFFTSYTLKKCRQNNSGSGEQLVLKIVLIVVGVFIGVSIVAATIFSVRQRCKEKQKQTQQVIPEEVIGKDETASPDHPKWLQEKRMLTTAMGMNDENIECVICLDEKPYLCTPCRHYFHMKCIVQWMTKSWDCPLCKRSNFTHLKLYCRECSQQYLDLSIARLKRKLEEWQTFQNVCTNCKKISKQDYLQQSHERLKVTQQRENLEPIRYEQ